MKNGGGTWVQDTKGLITIASNDSNIDNTNIVGLSSSNPIEINTGDVLGTSTNTLTESQLPPHNHGEKVLDGTIQAGGMLASDQNTPRFHCNGFLKAVSNSGTKYYSTANISYKDTTLVDAVRIVATHTHSTVGNGTAVNNIQPSIGVIRWHRIA